MWLLAWEFLLIKSVLHFAFLHLLSGYYYYDYVVIGVLRPSWFTDILFWIGLLLSKEVKQLKIIIIIIGRRDFFFFHARFTSFRTHTSPLTFFCFFVLFNSCSSHSQVFDKTFMHEFHISVNLTEWYLLYFPTGQLQVHNVYSERKSRNS